MFYENPVVSTKIKQKIHKRKEKGNKTHHYKINEIQSGQQDKKRWTKELQDRLKITNKIPIVSPSLSIINFKCKQAKLPNQKSQSG